MLTVSYKKHGIRLGHVWFATEDEAKEVYKFKNVADLIFLHGTNVEPSNGVLYTTQHTLIKDLTLSEEELFASLGKHLRAYINRSKKEGIVKINIYTSELLLKNSDVFSSCKKLFEKMYHNKGMDNTFNESLAKKYCNANSLEIAVAYIDENPVGFSAVIHDGITARLWLSAFDFRSESTDSQVLSRGHQQLDYELLVYLKNLGVQSFDFGGVNSFDEPNGIAKFKMKFESKNKVTYNNYLVPTNLIGKMALRFFFRNK